MTDQSGGNVTSADEINRAYFERIGDEEMLRRLDAYDAARSGTVRGDCSVCHGSGLTLGQVLSKPMGQPGPIGRPRTALVPCGCVPVADRKIGDSDAR